ncbi:MAG: SGNH/GDSL hydrolase family protein [Janthinobacterium lividum]
MQITKAFPALIGLLFLSSTSFAQNHWVASWGSAPMQANNPKPLDATITVRNIVHLSIGGTALRIVISNQYGAEPLLIDGASVAESDPGSKGALKPASSPLRITFSGKSTLSIPAGEQSVSDPVQLPTRPLEDLAVSLLLPAQKLTAFTQHVASHATNYTAAGDQLMQPALQNPTAVTPWHFLRSVSVLAPTQAGALVCFGDSITDGTGSTANANSRWPDILSAWFQSQGENPATAVLNEGIGGNRILHDGNGPAALTRYAHDVLSQDGVRSVIILEGINDIARTNAAFPEAYQPVTAADIIAGLNTLLTQGHARGLKVYAGTLTPYFGSKYYYAGGEQMRLTVNTFIRQSKSFDGVVDFDHLLADPANPQALLPAYEHGDHLHPSDAGYRVMAEGVENALFRHAVRPAHENAKH